MNILMVLDKKFPIDIRVENEAITLIKAGHQVGILSIAAYEKSEVISVKGIKVYRHAVSKFTQNKMHALAGMLPWMDRKVAKLVDSILKKEDYQAIHFHDLYLFGAARLIKKKHDVKFVGDMHENYVEVIKDYQWATKFPNRLLISHKKWERKERNWLQDMDKIITVSSGIRNRIISKGIDEDDVMVVPNTIHTDLFDEYSKNDQILKKMSSYFTLLYVGGFVSNRGLEHVIEGMVEVKKYAKDIRLVLVGDGDIRTDLEVLVKQHNVEDVVWFEGWHNQDEIKSYLMGGDVGLVPFKRTPQTDNSSSNKLFQYMYYEMPILGTNCTSVKKLIDLENAGIIYETENKVKFVEGVKSLYKKKELRKELGQNGRRAVLEKYNWNVTTSVMVEMYNDLEKK